MPLPPLSPGADLTNALGAIREGRATAAGLLEAAIQAAESPAARPAFTALHLAAARREAATAPSGSPLAGLAVSVKDLFDLRGDVTTAGSRVLAGAPPASADAPAVARLRAAGGAVIGRTQMVEFAFAGVGTNPHGAQPANPAYADVPRIPGGSSSGAAVSVATGAAWLGLGTDTGGSLRIPAALCGLVGFKSTAGLVPAGGCFPLAPSLDTVGAITRSVRDALLAHELLAGRTVAIDGRPLAERRFAVPQALMLDGLEPPVAAAFERALAMLRAAGATVEAIELPELREPAAMQQAGTLVAAEAWALHRDMLARDEAAYDPRVASRLKTGAALSADALAELRGRRSDWISRMNARLLAYDALLSPTVPLLAPTLASVLASDAVYFDVNARLLRNTSAVNFLDGCAISQPCQRPGEAPVGLMLWHGAGHDDAVLSAALQVEHALAA